MKQKASLRILIGSKMTLVSGGKINDKTKDSRLNNFEKGRSDCLKY